MINKKISGLKLNYKYVDWRDGHLDKIWEDFRILNNILGREAQSSLKDMSKSA
tara:strand:+ start:2554 stop:2712 length:159 start_codon:yes stop_codon:yes gene_type:complete